MLHTSNFSECLPHRYFNTTCVMSD